MVLMKCYQNCHDFAQAQAFGCWLASFAITGDEMRMPADAYAFGGAKPYAL
jgi:hypothetical protein